MDKQEKDVKRLRRADLLELLVEMGRENDALKAELAAVRAQLDERALKVESVGSMAEAALALSDVFAAADAACAQYLESVRAAYGERPVPFAEEGEGQDAEELQDMESQEAAETAALDAAQEISAAREEAERIVAAAREEARLVAILAQEQAEKAERKARKKARKIIAAAQMEAAAMREEACREAREEV